MERKDSNFTNIIFYTTQKTFSNTALLIKSFSGSFYIMLQGWYHWICKIVRKLKFKSWEGFQTVLSHIVDNNVTVFRLNPVLVNHVIHETRKLRKLISDIYKNVQYPKIRSVHTPIFLIKKDYYKTLIGGLRTLYECK